ncbi:MAG: hypothetical protein ACRDNW_10540 [Trebonia sp.]
MMLILPCLQATASVSGPAASRSLISLAARGERAAATTAMAAVAALVALIAAEVRLSARYLPVALALIVFLAGSALTGWLLGIRVRRPAAVAVLPTFSMRDFAIAAGLAAAAFGPAASAPLSLVADLRRSREDFAVGDTYTAAQVRAELEQRRRLGAQ